MSSDIPSVVDGHLHLDGVGRPGPAVGSPDWFAWLTDEAALSFAFRSPAGNYTARKERRRRGGNYWVAYRTAGGRQHKLYLGKADRLTAAGLLDAAAALAERVRQGREPSGPAPAPPEAPGALAATGGLPLLATKLFVPRPRPDLVPRPRLVDRLHDGLVRGGCTLLSASAGAGKTTLLAAWIAELDRPVGWLSLDEHDQDVHQFLRYLLAALQPVRPRPPAPLDGPPPPPDVVLTGLINDLVQRQDPAVLVLDDYHAVRSPAVHAAVAFLVEHLPPDLHLVIASREDPPLPLPRLRARAQLVELRAADLGFTVGEATAFLGGSMGLRLAAAEIVALVERTEGWAAGLQMAALALRDRPDPGRFVTDFAGGHRLVADYLSDEVLARQPAPIRRFLAATAVLDRLCAPLCDAVLADDPDAASIDSRQVLTELDRGNLFLVPLDDERTWYRYHHLFADTLRARLHHDADPARRAALHRRAGAWFGAQRLLPEAIEHALAGHATDEAAAWIETLTPVMFGSTDIQLAMDGWLEALPEPVRRARPMLCLAHAWLMVYRLQIGSAAMWVHAAAQALPEDDHPASVHTRGCVAAFQAMLATLGPDPSAAEATRLAEHALRDLPADDIPFRGIAAVALGQGALAAGDTELAEQALASAAAEGRAAGLVHGSLNVAGYQVAVQRLRGARRRALTTARTALAWAAERGSPPAPGLGALLVLQSDLLADGNELAEAFPPAVEGHQVVSRFAERVPLVVMATVNLARQHLYRGEPETAGELVEQLRRVVAHGPFAPLLPVVDAAQAMVRLAVGDTAAAAAWAVTVPDELPGMLRLQAHAQAGGIAALLVAPAQAMVTHGRAGRDSALLGEAMVRLDLAQHRAERGGLGWLGLRVSLLRALAADGLGDTEAARTHLAAAVADAEPEGVIRPFVDGGPALRALLAALRARGSGRNGTSGYLDTLLAAFGAPPSTGAAPAVRPSGLIEPLTARELEVLRLLAAGRSNAGMAHVLVVEQSTIKTHLVHLYGKLGVHSRTEAVARAHALRLLD
jgi:LuxR family maltose regulon positive regulatory protein